MEEETKQIWELWSFNEEDIEDDIDEVCEQVEYNLGHPDFCYGNSLITFYEFEE